MLLGHLTLTETQYEDLILSQVQRMNVHEVPLFFDFQVNSITLACPFGSKSCCQRPTHQLSASLPELNAKQVLSARLVFEKRAKCQDFVARYKEDAFAPKLIASFYNTSTNIAVHHQVN